MQLGAGSPSIASIGTQSGPDMCRPDCTEPCPAPGNKAGAAQVRELQTRTGMPVPRGDLHACCNSCTRPPLVSKPHRSTTSPCRPQWQRLTLFEHLHTPLMPMLKLLMTTPCSFGPCSF
eukprot:377906-Pelagomonas_calceolata.AAC.1